MIENQNALELRSDSPPADEALFNLGMIYADPNKLGHDYQRALEYFDRLERDFPDSDLTPIARVWRRTIEANNKLTREVVKRRRMLKRAWDENRAASKLLKQHNVEIKKSEDEKRRLNEELEKLNQIILESKQVDIEIEAKKRQSTQ